MSINDSVVVVVAGSAIDYDDDDVTMLSNVFSHSLSLSSLFRMLDQYHHSITTLSIRTLGCTDERRTRESASNWSISLVMDCFKPMKCSRVHLF